MLSSFVRPPDHPPPWQRLLADEAATRALGAALAQQLPQPLAPPAFLISLEGDLGAGKTTLVRGLLQALAPQESVKSPTYSLVEPHLVSGINFYHFDFYRINHPDEFWDAGLDEYFAEAAVCLAEWPQRVAPHLPVADWHIQLAPEGTARRATLQAGSARGWACLTKLLHNGL